MADPLRKEEVQTSTPSAVAAAAASGQDADWAMLLRSVADGDRASFGKLYDLSNPQVFGLVKSIVADQGAAEEVTLDVYVQVWKQASRFDASRGRPLSWLLLIARSRSIDFLRSRVHKARSSEQELDREQHRFPAPSPDPESALVASSEAQTVRKAVAGLDDGQRSALELAFFEGLSHRQIAERLSLPLGTVKGRIRSAMMQLRAQLEPLAGVQ